MFRLACVLLLLLLTYQLVAQAKFVPSIITREEDLSNCRNQRTLFKIIWSCISTTIICAWAAIHPNIPPREGPFKAILRKLELMFWTIVAPEILPCWALNQLLAAMTVRDVYNDRKGYKKEDCGIWKTVKGWFSLNKIKEAVKAWFSLYEIKEAASKVWTLKHGHFLIMGGIHLVEPSEEAGTTTVEPNTVVDKGAASETIDVQARNTASENADTEKGGAPSGKKLKPKAGRVTILTLEMLRELVNDPEFEIEATEDDIAHTSKGDALSKIIFILQSTWFITHCLARWAQGLNLTQLELTTLALASLNGITFALWWDKPLGAKTLVRLHLKRKLTEAEREAGHVRDSPGPFPSTIPFFKYLFRPFASPWAIFLLPLIPLLVVIAFTVAFTLIIIDLVVGGSTSFPADATHVSTFYVPNHRYSKAYHALLLLALGIIFGAIHCAGWNLPFPTHSEQKLWRIASLAVTIIPIGVFPLAGIVIVIVKLLTAFQSSSDFDAGLGGSTVVISALAYAAARLVLLGQALALLRDLPQAAFIAVDWTKFYPHFF